MFTDLSVAMMNNLLWMPWPCCYLVWLLFACSRSSRAALSPDGLALLEFKTHITYDADGRLNDWKASDDTPCAWTGVTCVPSGNASVVSELNLPLATMEGSLSASLGSLANLTALDLRRNRLSGAIPNEIVNCKLLTSLDLSYNLLNGSIPALGALTNLTFLDLSGNDLSGDIGTLALANGLKWLGLEGNQFAGSLPNMSGRKELMYLSFNGKLTGGKIPDLSASREVLWELRMRGTQLEGPLPTWIANLPSLLTLDLSSNNLSGQIQRVGDPGQTSGLELQGIQLSGACAATCPSWKVLYFLDLSHNSGVNLVNSSLELMLTSFSQLAELHLSNIGSSGRLVRPRAGAPTARTFDSPLKVLDLSVSNLEGDLFHSIFADAHLLFRHLESLNLSGNRLTGQVPPGLAVLPNLRALDLSNNRLSGPLPAFRPHLQNATFFAGNSELCGFPLKPCKPPSPKSLVLPVALALVACLLLFAASCVFFAWRLRKYNLRHQQDAQLIAVMQGKKRANLMPLAELRKATSNFSQESQIGVGGFGTVHKGTLNDGTTVAIKRSNREEGSQEDKEQFLNEVNILSHVNHRNLVRLLGCCLENRVALLVFEYVPSGTLQENLRNPRVPLTWEQRVRIAVQTAKALAYLHSAANPPIFHRDVKSANILLDEDMNAKVADFGISKLAPLDATHVSTQAVQGTMGYIDPEYYTSFQFSAKSDVYSFGVVLLELISAQAPVDFARGPEDAGLAKFALSHICRGDLRDIVDPAIDRIFADSDTGKESIAGVAALAVKCLEPRSRDRPSMKELSKELQGLWLQLQPTVFTSYNEDGQQGSGPVHSEHTFSIDGAFLSQASLLASYSCGR